MGFHGHKNKKQTSLANIAKNICFLCFGTIFLPHSPIFKDLYKSIFNFVSQKKAFAVVTNLRFSC